MLYLLEMLLLYLLAAVCEDDLSQELTFITDVGGFAEILNEGDDLIQGSQRPIEDDVPDARSDCDSLTKMASPLPLTNITTTGAQRVPRGQRAKCYGSGHCLEQTIFHARLSRHSYMRGQHARLSFVADDRLQHARHSYVSSIARSIQLSQRRGVSVFPPWCRLAVFTIC